MRKGKKIKVSREIICPFLSAINDSLRDFCVALIKYEQLKFEESQINNYFLKNKVSGSVVLVFDAKCAGNTYGDFTNYLLLAKVLQSKFVVKFIIVTDEPGRHWRDMNLDEVKVLTDQYILLASAVVHNPEANVVLARSFNEVKVDEMLDLLIFRRKTNDRKLDFWDLHRLLIILYRKGWFGSESLLSKNDFTPPKVSPVDPYVVWHIRYGSKSATNKIESSESFIENYKQLRNIFGNEIEIIVCSSSAGLSEIFKIAASNNFKLTSSREYSQDFRGDLGLAFHAKLFVQLGNGGVFQYFFFSSEEFLVTGLCLDGLGPVDRLLLNTKRTPYLHYPWLQESQILATEVYSPKSEFAPPTKWKEISINLKSRGLVE